MTTVPLILLGLISQVRPMVNDEYNHLPPDQRDAARQIEAMGGIALLEHCDGKSPVSVLTFRGEKFTDKNLSLLLPFRGTPVYGVGFVKAKVSDEGIARTLKQFTNVKAVTVFEMDAADAALAPLADFRNLEEVTLAGTRITSATVKHLTHQQSLRLLDLSETEIDDSALRHLEPRGNLTWLSLHKTKVTSAGLASVGRLEALERLFLYKTGVGDEGLKHLLSLKKLETLGLDETNVTNAGMQHLEALESLKTLYIEHTKVDAQGLNLLQNMPKLQEVRWEGSRAPTPPMRRFNTLFHLHLPANADVPLWRKDRDKYERGELELDFP